MSIPRELDHPAVPNNFLPSRKNQLAQASFERETFRPRVLRSAVAPHWLALISQNVNQSISQTNKQTNRNETHNKSIDQYLIV